MSSSKVLLIILFGKESSEHTSSTGLRSMKYKAKAETVKTEAAHVELSSYASSSVALLCPPHGRLVYPWGSKPYNLGFLPSSDEIH